MVGHALPAAGRALQLARLAAALPAFLRQPVSPAMARRQIAERLATRGERFLDLVDRTIFANPAGIYARLLARAGIGRDALVRCVRAAGVEPALEELRERGVYLTLDEIRHRTPVERDGVTLPFDEASLANPLLAGGVVGRSSGTRSAGTAVAYTWPFFEEEASAECLLYECHGVRQSAGALWLPGPPGIAGLHNMFLHVKMAHPLARWYSHTPPPAWRSDPFGRAVLTATVGSGRACGVAVPFPRHVPLERAADVGQWLAAQEATPRSIKTYASSAVRIAGAAREHGLDLSGAVAFAGGEPLTADRRRFIESSGLRVHPRYVTTESGLVAGACGHLETDAPDAMHIYQDRVAVIAGPHSVRVNGRALSSLLITSLSRHTPRVLLNTQLGDFGELGVQECRCEFGALGLGVRVAHVMSPEKLTGEGMNLATVELHRIVSRLVQELGGAPDDCQLKTAHDRQGLAAITVLVDPSVPGLDERVFVERIWEELRRASGGAALAADLWRSAGALRIARERPRATAGHKILPVDDKP
jgi:hypothetical protein